MIVTLPYLQHLLNLALQINEAGASKHFRGFWNHKYDDKDTR